MNKAFFLKEFGESETLKWEKKADLYGVKIINYSQFKREKTQDLLDYLTIYFFFLLMAALAILSRTNYLRWYW